MEPNEKLLASRGKKLIDDTATHTDNHYGVEILEDTVIETWTSGGIDLVKHFNIATKTLTTANPTYTIPSGYAKGDQTFKLTSGSVDMLRR